MEIENIHKEEFLTALLRVDRVQAARVFRRCSVDYNSFPVLESLITDSLEVIGEGWEKREISLAQVYMSGIICEELIEKASLEFVSEPKSQIKLAIGTLADYHSLGKRIVYASLKSTGYNPLDLGLGLSAAELVEKSIKFEIELLLISTLMLPSALQVIEVTSAFKKKSLPIKTIVGGAPFRLDPSLWEKVGADAHGVSGTSVGKIIEEVMEGKKNESNGTSFSNTKS